MIMTSYSSEEVGKKVRVMFPPVIQPDEPDEPESDLGSESQLSTATTATAESPFLPKVKARRNMVADNELLQRRKKRYVASKIFKRRQSELTEKELEETTELETREGILEIFTRSLENHLTMENMWSELKIDAVKRLQPVISRAHELNRLATPSTKQCLHLYKRPAPVDHFTGKPIPLGQVLNQMKRNNLSRGTMSILNSAMSQVIRYSQIKAEIMLQRKDPHNQMITDTHQDFTYFTTAGLSHPPTTSRTVIQMRPPSPTVRRITGSSRRRLPYYLTNTGNLISASLEELDGEIICCTPSTNRPKPEDYREGEGQATTTDGSSSSTLLLTDMESGEEARSEKTVSSESTIPVKTNSYHEPLTTAALLEHASVSQIPIRGRGFLAHGQYEMWRPDSCYSINKDSTRS